MGEKMYLTGFTFPNEDREADYLWDSGMISVYPFKLLSKRGLEKLDFSPVTILYGGNGSGKSTALNIIAEKLKIERDSIYSKSRFFLDYVEMCGADAEKNIPKSSKIITSDDVFDYMLNIRNLNEGIEVKREEYNKEYLDAKYSAFRVNSIEDYERLRTMNKTRRLSRKQFVKGELIDSVRELSNGESAFTYFTGKIEENGLYILDEPENSLSPKRQLELKKFIEDSVRFFNCQFVISTHSPFLLAMTDSKIYDLDQTPVRIRNWTELENVRMYRDFFVSKEKEFQ